MINKYRELLQNHLRSCFNVTNEDTERIASYFNVMFINSGQHFLKEGDKANAIVFITEGIMRSHWLDAKNNDVTNFFFKENQFLVSLESYLSGKPSLISLHAVTDCKLLVIKKADEQKLVDELLVWSSLFNKLVQTSLIWKVADKNMLKSVSAKEKYTHFLSTNGDIALRIPLQYIASYLGITPQSLSRIRRQNH